MTKEGTELLSRIFPEYGVALGNALRGLNSEEKIIAIDVMGNLSYMLNY